MKRSVVLKAYFYSGIGSGPKQAGYYSPEDRVIFLIHSDYLATNITKKITYYLIDLSIELKI